MKLLVRNLAVATTEEKLVSLFSEHGTVQSCNLVLDAKTGKSKGFGFIEMPKPGEAKAAMKSLNGYKLAGNLIRVKKAESKTETADSPASDVKTPSVQFKQAPKTPTVDVSVATEPKDVTEQTIDNTGNAANIYGKIKSEDKQ